VATSLPQPIGAVIAYLAVEEVSGLLPVSFGFAAGAMLALVAADMAPKALRGGDRRIGIGGMTVGATVMWGLSVLLNVQ
jgi:ZIP family zinc transporter